MNTAARQPQLRRQQHVDLALAGTLLLIGVLLLIAIAGLPAGTSADPVGPRGFPSLLAVGFLGSATALAAKAMLARRHPRAYLLASADPDSADSEGPVLRSRLVLASITIVGYVLLLPIVGFLLITPAFIVALIIIQGGVATRSLIVMAVGFPIAVYLLFAVLLGVPLPGGVFDPMSLGVSDTVSLGVSDTVSLGGGR
jgi:putative tricarboxylic transport membrane protein